MKLKTSIGKRGDSTVTILKYFGMAMAAIVILLLILYWRDVKNDTFLERNYLARDISLLLTTSYASPGDLIYCYYPVGDYAGKFDYLIEKSRVVVADASSGGIGLEKGAAYFYAEGVTAPVPQVKIIDTESKNVALFQIVKDDNGVRVLPKKRGEDASPCKSQ